jgi:hypothetical protein
MNMTDQAVSSQNMQFRNKPSTFIVYLLTTDATPASIVLFFSWSTAMLNINMDTDD